MDTAVAQPKERRVEDVVLPGLTEAQQWTCENGCGNCRPEQADFEYSREEAPDGVLLNSKTCKVWVSHCCKGNLVLWDERKQAEVPWMGGDLNLDGLVSNREVLLD
ncbi:hypothetical protein [Paraburkholderia fungorum]|uniref:Uncharacterized protein n=1 Tax=Paraburkholderia fungorum TaxID=134537 RepID=A0AAW3V1L9_9BURK|nr:hypothetical protein [Paraburkholderia fungorum]MBB4517365.1 hypothetical protein [Paraburkholderia fungorum]MBB6204434.1 hypothetical protein [Paraburkholderia fungorum]